MTNEEIKEQLAQTYPDITDWEAPYGMLTFTVPASLTLEVAQYLYHQLQFQFLTDLTAIHYPDKVGAELCAVYQLHNLMANVRVRVKTYVPIAQPDVPSLTALFAGANWLEREAYDFFGVNYIGHPNLTRIMNVEEMDYFPMRKEYPMEDPTRTDKDDEMFGRG